MFLTNKKFILLLFIVLLASQFAWGYFRFSEKTLWFDNFAHAVGGITVAALFFAFLETKEYFGKVMAMPLWTATLMAVSFVALIGVAWEIYEYLIEYFFVKVLGSYATMQLEDTLLDLVADLAGGALASVLYLKSKD